MDKQVEISIEDLSEPLTYPAEAFTSPKTAAASKHKRPPNKPMHGNLAL